MTRHFMCAIILAAANALPSAACADLRSIGELPVAATRVVAPSEYREAAALAANGGFALDVTLKIVGRFEGLAQRVTQINDRSDSPSFTRFTVVRNGLLDDSVRDERWEITLERTRSGIWRINEVVRAWRCWRGEPLEYLSIEPCR